MVSYRDDTLEARHVNTSANLANRNPRDCYIFVTNKTDY